MAVVSITAMGLLGMTLLSSRLTEGAIYRASVTAISQGFIEQTKNMPYELVPVSPVHGTDMTAATYVGLYSVPTLKDDVTQDPIVLSPLPALSRADVTLGTVPNGVYDNVKTYDVARAGDLVIHVWAWVEDATPAAAGTTQAVKAVTLLYMWQVRDGSKTRNYVDRVKMIRSLVPTY